jgi:hypothetical protein
MVDVEMKLSDLPWILPLLQQVAAGETLQLLDTAYLWVDATEDDFVSFNSKKEKYRIKPKVPEYRLFWWKDGRYKPQVIARNSGAFAFVGEAEQYQGYVNRGDGVWLTEWAPIPEPMKA